MNDSDRSPASSAAPGRGTAAGAAERARLHELDLEGLRELAATDGLGLPPGLGREELLFELQKHRFAQGGHGFGEGVLEVLPDGFGFLRAPRRDYEPGPDDVYVSPAQVRRLNLRTGHHVAGPARAPRRGEKYLALVHVESVDGAPVEDLARRAPFEQLTPVLPRRRLPLEHPGAGDDVRVLDLLAPWGFGQRVLVQAPPGSGRTWLATRITAAALAASPPLSAILCLLDERPEDVTEVRRQVASEARCEVVATTFDQPPARHTALAEMALCRAQRLVETGRDVLLAVDSLTALVRAFHQEVPHSGKLLAAGLDSQALLWPKRLFAAARNVEGGGSLTVVATVLVGTGSRVDECIAEQFAGKGNSDVVLERGVAGPPAPIDVLRTGTRREDCLLPPAAVMGLRALRAELAGLLPPERLPFLTRLLAAHPRNADLLAACAAPRG